MADLTGFNANDVEPLGSFDPVPAGKYVAVITASEYKPTKAGTGSYMELTFQIIEGEHENRLAWARLNLDNPNPQAVEIAQRELSAICHAIDVLTPQDSGELHDIPLVINVKCRKRSDTGEITNEIKGYEKREPPQAAAPGPQDGGAPPEPQDGGSPPEPQDGGSTPPWKRTA